MPELSKEFVELCNAVTAKRPKTVIEHILKHGFITTEDLKVTYGYSHPPRAARDVREHGIPLETFRVMGSDGRKIAAYRFGTIVTNKLSRLSGRTGLSKSIKNALIKKHGAKCFIYLEEMDERELQIDHRVPYEVSGDVKANLNPEDFMLLSGSANRAKSWSCEHCENWISLKNPLHCSSCYWAFPENYSHIAMRQLRQLSLIWQEHELDIYNKLQNRAHLLNMELSALVKEIIENAVTHKF